MIRNMIIAVLLTFILAGCARPKPTFMKPPSQGGEIYLLAWKDGCESGFSVYGNSYWRTFYTYKANIKLMNSNKLYSRVWWDSFNFCRHYLNRYQMDGFWGSEGFGSGQEANFNQGLRNARVFDQKGFSFPWWEGADTPGWGEHTWGGDVGGEGDWLWRSGDDQKDWLGRTPAYQ